MRLILYARGAARAYVPFLALVISAMISGCLGSCGGGGGNGKTKTGHVEGTVYLPFTLTASLQPASDVQVRLSGGDYLETVTTGTDGRFGFDDVPARTLTLLITPASCLADSQLSVSVVADDTLNLEVTLEGDVSGGCLAIPFAGAERMEIDQATNQAVLLYDTTIHSNPALMVVDLATGAAQVSEFTDIDDVFDLAFISSSVVVFNCFKAGQGFYLRFWDIQTMTSYRADVQYAPYRGAPPAIDDLFGKLAVTPSGSDVFVSHRMRQGATFDGKIYCINVAQGVYTDADQNALDGEFAFDPDLVAGSINWPYGLAIDGATGELLVGNYLDTLVIAINLTDWGTFDRDANLVAPIPGVRKIPMSSGVAGFKPWFWGFAGGRGVAANPSYGYSTYVSGGSGAATTGFEPNVQLTSPTQHLAIDPVRGSWFTLVFDASRPQAVQRSVEERSLTTLAKLRRYETQFTVLPELRPRAFAVNSQTSNLYVTYDNRAIIEVFPLPVNP
jgi:hypothetical protein